VLLSGSILVVAMTTTIEGTVDGKSSSGVNCFLMRPTSTLQFWALLQVDYAVDVSTLREALPLDKSDIDIRVEE
jgi:hypothetical protein